MSKNTSPYSFLITPYFVVSWLPYRWYALVLKKACILASFPVFLLAARFIPWERIPSLCVFYHATGLPCPSCGITRAIVALTHFQFRRAMEMNALGFVLVGVLALWWVTSIYEIATSRRTRLSRWAGRKAALLAVIGLGVFIAFGTARIWLLVHGRTCP